MEGSKLVEFMKPSIMTIPSGQFIFIAFLYKIVMTVCLVLNYAVTPFEFALKGTYSKFKTQKYRKKLCAVLFSVAEVDGKTIVF
jgi:hypothetical protein